ncbi:MAG: hypothetical protein AAF081_15900 [Actinomycetota bacterium]
MSRPPAPSMRPALNVITTAVGLAVLGRLLVGSGDPGVFGIVVVVISLIAMAGVVLARQSGALPKRLLAPSLLGLFLAAALGAFVL